MTSEEIEQIIVEHYGAPLPGMMPVARSLVLKAYEEAAKAVCIMCDLDIPSKIPEGGEGGYYFHKCDGEYRFRDDDRCEASPIRRLAASLSETVEK
jgi:hypothetical protein